MEVSLPKPAEAPAAEPDTRRETLHNVIFEASKLSCLPIVEVTAIVAQLLGNMAFHSVNLAGAPRDDVEKMVQQNITAGFQNEQQRSGSPAPQTAPPANDLPEGMVDILTPKTVN